MIRLVALDSGPLGVITRRRGTADGDACRNWEHDLRHAGIRVIVPEIADYEVRREHVRSANATAIARLDTFITGRADRYVPITTDAIRLAADLWARARNTGVPTADRHALDGDVILAAQALTLGYAASEIMVATTNVDHLSRYVGADLWSNIRS